MIRRYITVLIIGIIIVGGALFYFKNPKSDPSKTLGTTCKNAEMIFYYSDSCSWCQKVKDEGTITKIKELGIKVKEINTETGPVLYQFQGVPTFIINDKVYSGYKTFDELEELLGCPADSKQGLETPSQAPSSVTTEKLKEIVIDASKFEYNPSVVTVKRGERIKLVINNTDTLHGIRIPELEISGNDFVEFTAEKTGEFTWYCNNFCGQGHQEMQGKLIVE